MDGAPPPYARTARIRRTHRQDTPPMTDSAAPPATLRLSRRLPAPAALVFDAWLDPAWLSRWMFGPDVRDERIVVLALEPRVGGAFSFKVERGGTVLEHAGRYTALERPARLAFTWGAWPEDRPGTADSTVEIAIADDGPGCVLTLVHGIPAEWAAWAGRTEAGWARMLEALATALDADAPGQRIAADALRFERRLPGPLSRAWACLIEPGRRARWLADGPLATTPGGDVALAFRNADLSRDDDPAPPQYRSFENAGDVFGVTLRCEPPHRLALTWSDMPGEPEPEDPEVDIALREDGDAVVLTLTHTRLQPQELPTIAGGWHTHLGLLDDLLCGRAPRQFWRTFARMEALYAAAFERQAGHSGS